VKTSRIIVAVACSIIVCAMFSGLASALSQEEATASVAWVPLAPLPGNSVTASVIFINNSPNNLTVESVSIHFDWMGAGLYVGATLPNPVTVPVNDSQVLSPLLINIPSNVTSGTHTYTIGIDGVQGTADFSWDSTQLMITIGAGDNSQSFNSLNTTVAGKLSTAENANYRSSRAQALLQQAIAANTQAQGLARNQSWVLAVSSLQTASSLLDQAATAEQNYKPTFWDQYLMIVIVGVVVAAVVAVLLVLFMVRRRRKQSETPPVAQTPPPPAEQPSPSFDI
jgi:hypothetical protein